MNLGDCVIFGSPPPFRETRQTMPATQRNPACRSRIYSRFLIGDLALATTLLLSARVLSAQALSVSPVTRLGDLYAQVGRDNPRISGAQAVFRAAQARVAGA